MEKKFKRELNALNEVFDFISDFASAHQIAEPIRFAITLAIDELFTNTIEHNPQGAGAVVIDMSRDGNSLIVTLIDSDAKPFDVTQAKDPKIDLPLEERQAGGLGIHLTKKMVDEIRYEYKDRQSKIILVKNLET